MKISDVIEKLQEKLREHGDVDLVIRVVYEAGQCSQWGSLEEVNFELTENYPQENSVTMNVELD